MKRVTHNVDIEELVFLKLCAKLGESTSKVNRSSINETAKTVKKSPNQYLAFSWAVRNLVNTGEFDRYQNSNIKVIELTLTNKQNLTYEEKELRDYYYKKNEEANREAAELLEYMRGEVKKELWAEFGVWQENPEKMERLVKGLRDKFNIEYKKEDEDTIEKRAKYLKIDYLEAIIIYKFRDMLFEFLEKEGTRGLKEFKIGCNEAILIGRTENKEFQRLLQAVSGEVKDFKKQLLEKIESEESALKAAKRNQPSQQSSIESMSNGQKNMILEGNHKVTGKQKHLDELQNKEKPCFECNIF